MPPLRADLIVPLSHAAWPSFDRRNAQASRHIRWRMTANLRASATVAFLPLIFLTSRVPQTFTDPLRGGPPCAAVRDDAGHFEQIATQRQIVALRYAPTVADLTRLVAPWRQAEVGPHTAGFGKPRRIVDDTDKGQRDHGSDARRRHQPPHRLVAAPDASAPCAWNTSFARSNPIALTSPTDGSFKWSSTPQLWHIDAVGGRPRHRGPRAPTRPQVRTKSASRSHRSACPYTSGTRIDASRVRGALKPRQGAAVHIEGVTPVMDRFLRRGAGRHNTREVRERDEVSAALVFRERPNLASRKPLTCSVELG